MNKQELDTAVAKSREQCPGGDGCTCCGPGCDCGCRNVCPRFRYEVGKKETTDQPSEVAGEPKKQVMLYQECVACGGVGCRCCKTIGVMATGVTESQLEYISKLDVLRQEAGISAAMLRDGRARKMVDTYRSEHQSDEDEPATEDWLRSLPGSFDNQSEIVVPVGCNQLRFGFDTFKPEWVAKWSLLPSTGDSRVWLPLRPRSDEIGWCIPRGFVRLFCKSLGTPINEKSH